GRATEQSSSRPTRHSNPPQRYADDAVNLGRLDTNGIHDLIAVLPEKNTTSSDDQPIIDSSKRPIRHRQVNHNKEGVVNHGDLNSAEFDELARDGIPVEAQDTVKKINAQKKTEEQLKFKEMMKPNANVVLASGQNGTPDVHTPDAQVVEENTLSKNNISTDLGTNITRKQLPDQSEVASHLLPTNSVESFLDSTVRLSAEQETQTEKCNIFCSCKKCQELVADYFFFMKSGHAPKCTAHQKEETTEGKDNSKITDNNGTFLSSLAVSAEEDYAPLFKGSEIKVTVTTKGQLRALDKDPQSTPKDYVYLLMESLFPHEELARMSALGRTPNSIPVPKNIRKAIMDFNEGILNYFINAKCYMERRKGWSKEDPNVRPRMKKNMRDPNKPATSKKSCDRQSKPGSKKKSSKGSSSSKNNQHSSKQENSESKQGSKDNRRSSKQENSKSKQGPTRESKSTERNPLKKRENQSRSEGNKIHTKSQTQEKPHKNSLQRHRYRNSPLKPRNGLSPNKRNGISRELFFEERATTAGKRPKSLEEIMKYRKENSFDDLDTFALAPIDTSTPLNKSCTQVTLVDKNSMPVKQRRNDPPSEEDDDDDEEEDDKRDCDSDTESFAGKESNDSGPQSSQEEEG
ncbi:Adhesion G protein-coupled receptor F4, partial [Frankliniella fusca]